MTRIFLSPPHMEGTEAMLVQDAFASNFVAPAGPMIDRFEQMFAEYSGIPYAVALTSGTAALHLALRMIGVKPGDTVFTSSLTFIGGAAPILYQGATPVFIDNDATSWAMDPQLLAQALADAKKKNALPKAVVPTDIYGQSCDLDALLDICNPYGIPVITDSAESVGGKYKNRHCGDGALMAAFSFNGNKIITTSGGGMLASHDEKLIKEARFLSQQAREPVAHYEHKTFGYNYRLSNISAAIGCGQMGVLAKRVQRRREIFSHYEKALSNLPGVGFMPEAKYGVGNRWLTVMMIDPKAAGVTHEDVRLALEAQNIEARPLWKPMHMQPVFKDCKMIGGKVCESLFAQGLCLPSGTQMSKADLARVVDIIRGVCDKRR